MENLRSKCSCINHLDMYIISILLMSVVSIKQFMVSNKLLELGSTSLVALYLPGFLVLPPFFFFFFCHTAIGILIILIYVDDISGTRSSATQIHSFISRLSSIFALRDLGPTIYFLDIKVHRRSTYLHLNQTKYKHDLLKRIAIIEAKSALTLGSLGKPFSFSYGDQLLSDSSLYRRTVGGL